MSPPEIAAHLEQAIDDIPSSGRGFVRGSATTRGLTGEAGWRIKRRWEAGGWASRSWRGTTEAGIQIRGQW